MNHFELINNRIYLRIFSNSASVLIMAMILWGFFYQKHRQFTEAPAIKWESVDTVIIKSRPEIPENYTLPTIKKTQNTDDFQSIKIPQNHLVIKRQQNNDGLTMPSIINNVIKNGITSNVNNKSSPILPKISTASQKTIISTECLTKVDSEDRPKGCPPNNIARKLIQAARAPKYRPEMVEGFSKAENNSRYYAGIRGKCQKEDGSQSTICIPIGKKPARVKTPYELCVEMGMGGCTRPPRADGTKDESFNYGNE